MNSVRFRALVLAASGGALLSSCSMFKNDEDVAAETSTAAGAYASDALPPAYGAGAYDTGTTAYVQPPPGGYTQPPYTQPPYTQPPTGPGYAGTTGAGYGGNESFTQPPAAGGRTHTVARGDTLSGISRRYGVGINQIMTANNLASADLIKEGQRLTIP